MIIIKNFKDYKGYKCLSPPLSSSFLPAHQVITANSLVKNAR